MFIAFLAILIVGAVMHIARLEPRTTERAGEVMLLYILVGYCGVAMLAVGVLVLAKPTLAAQSLGFAPGSEFEDFVGVCLVAMSLVSLFALRYRRGFLIGPAILWAVYFAGATAIHVKNFQQSGTMTHGGLLEIFATHGVITVLLVGSLVASGELKAPKRAQAV